MNYLTKSNSKIYPVFAWVIFGLLMLYLVLRAYFVAPLHDEVATLFHYIESGIYWGPDLILDANNHLLNSAVGHWIYLIFGDDFFFLRLPNVLAFAFYFWGIYRFIKPIPSALSKALILIGTTCIPYILEYFAYTRGYGISMGLFVFSLSYIRDFVVNRELKAVYWSCLLLCLAVYSNLTFLLTLILVGLLFVLIQWMYRKEFNRKQHVFLGITYLLLGISMLPNLYYAHLLKANGALYYGSLAGFWEVTGKTLARYIIFHDLNWLKYASLLAIFALIYFLIRRWIKLGSMLFFTKSSTVLAWLLFGNCVAIILMAKILKINYPEDRVGMHLAVLFLLLVGFVLSQHKYLKWLLLGMLFFPITMIPRINLTTSVFTPDDRMSKSFFQEVNKQVNSYATIAVYPLQQLTWSYFSRCLDSNNYVSSERDFNRTAEIVITKTTLFKGQDFLKNYTSIAHDPESDYIAYQRKTPYIKKVIYNLPVNIHDSKDEYITIFQSEIPDYLRNRKLQFHFHAKVTAENSFGEFAILAYSTFSKEMQSLDYTYVNERWVHGTKKEFSLNFNYAVDELRADENEIRIYIHNRKNEKISLENGVFEILELSSSDEGELNLKSRK